jgi:hypothetical protein
MLLTFWIVTGLICFYLHVRYTQKEKIPMTKINNFITLVFCLILGPFSLGMLNSIMFLDLTLFNDRNK